MIRHRWEHHQVSGLRGFGGFDCSCSPASFPENHQYHAHRRRAFLWKPKWPWLKTKEIVPNSDDGYLAYGTGLQGAGFLSLTPHLGALPPSHQDAPGKTLPTVNSNGPLKDVKWDDPVPLRVAEIVNRSGTCCCGQIRARLRGKVQSRR